jgi:HPt (histidine-containing phosphotransfer) domain-containing protein
VIEVLNKRREEMDTKNFKYDIQGMADELEVDIVDIIDLYSNYISEMNKEISSMQKLLLKGDWFNLEKVIHNIKGVSANLNITDVYQAAEIFDAELKRTEIENVQANTGKLIDMLNEAVLEIKGFFLDKGITLI